CRWAMADVARAPELARLLTGVDAVATAVGPCAEYEKRILLTCAEKGTPAASIGDGTLSGDDRREIHDAFRLGGSAAVSGCGMMPGWTELLSVHFLAGGRTAAGGRREPALPRYFICSLDRFGGYAFFRRTVKDTGREATAPPGSPPGCYFSMGEDRFGLPPGRPAGIFRGLGTTLGALGPVGKELSAAFLFWLRRSLRGAEGTPAAAAGVWTEGKNNQAAAVEDIRGRLAGVLLAEVALRLAAGRGKEKGLLPLPEVIGREEAERIAVESGGRILAGSPPRFNAG
ncbi:MAG TPA: hypothetical protein VK863_08270, partial [Candidatus Limnocylindrales bacterium]|nr:hypothetical protein [Candidatus Limnocylindrales bacterium]